MQKQDFTTTILVDQSPQEVFRAINNPRAWWSEEIEGSTDKLHDAFKYHFEDIHRCQLKLIEVVPDQKVVWLVMDNYFKPGIFEAASRHDELLEDKSVSKTEVIGPGKTEDSGPGKTDHSGPKLHSEHLLTEAIGPI